MFTIVGFSGVLVLWKPNHGFRKEPNLKTFKEWRGNVLKDFADINALQNSEKSSLALLFFQNKI